MQAEAKQKTIPGREADFPGGWEGLAMAVIFQACADYRKARRDCSRHPDSRKAKAAVRQLERFFASAWFRTLTNLNGQKLLQQIKEEMR